MRQLFKKRLFQLGAAILLASILTHLLTQRINDSQWQATGSFLAVAAIQNSFDAEVMKLDTQENTILIQCINNYSMCNKDQVAKDIAALNMKRDAVIKQEQVNVAKLKALLHQ